MKRNSNSLRTYQWDSLRGHAIKVWELQHGNPWSGHNGVGCWVAGTMYMQMWWSQCSPCSLVKQGGHETLLVDLHDFILPPVLRPPPLTSLLNPPTRSSSMCTLLELLACQNSTNCSIQAIKCGSTHPLTMMLCQLRIITSFNDRLRLISCVLVYFVCCGLTSQAITGNGWRRLRTSSCTA